MKKIKSLFIRKFDNHNVVECTHEVTPGCEWVIDGEGVPTRKRDGTCCLVEYGVLYRRYDCKQGKTPPNGFIPCCDPDPVTGHWPGWVIVNKYKPSGDERYYVQGYINTFGSIDYSFENGTYELCGPKIQNNPENLSDLFMFKHGGEQLLDFPKERTWENIRDYLNTHYIEGIVFHRENGDLCKIKRTDFGFEWNNNTSKCWRG